MSKRVSPFALSVLLVMCLCACSSQSQPEVQPPPQPPPRPQLHVPFSLAYEQTVAVADTSLRLTFVKVVEDSRCPADVDCFWAGTADIEVKVTSGAESTLILLSTYHREKQEASVFGYRIQLEDVTPHRSRGQEIVPSQYSAHLKVTPLPKN